MNPTSRGSRPRRDDRRDERSRKRNPTPWLAIALCVALAGCGESSGPSQNLDDYMDQESQRQFFMECLDRTNGSASDGIVKECKDAAYWYEFNNAAARRDKATTQPTGQSK